MCLLPLEFMWVFNKGVIGSVDRSIGIYEESFIVLQVFGDINLVNVRNLSLHL